jgi:hypothetical protein
MVGRDGQQLELPLTIASAQRPVYDDQGSPTGQVVTAGYVGLVPAVDWVRQPVTAVPAYMWDLTSRSVVALV